MAQCLSSRRMNRSWQRFFSRVSAVLGLLLVASLAHAGSACVSAFGAGSPGVQAAGQDCLSARPAPDTCVVIPQRIEVGIAAAAPSSPEPPPAVWAAEHATGIFPAVAELRSPAGLVPASPVPVHILLRRYLS